MERKREGFIKKNAAKCVEFRQENICLQLLCSRFVLFKAESFNLQHFGWTYRVFLVKPAWASSGPGGDTELVPLLNDGWSFCPHAASFDYILLTDAAPPRTNAAFYGPAGSVAPPSDGNECPLFSNRTAPIWSNRCLWVRHSYENLSADESELQLLSFLQRKWNSDFPLILQIHCDIISVTDWFSGK